MRHMRKINLFLRSGHKVTNWEGEKGDIHTFIDIKSETHKLFEIARLTTTHTHISS